jgi:hypothetical protein
MSRRAARITHDEVARMVRAVRSCGLQVGRVSFDGEKVDVIIADSGEEPVRPVDGAPQSDGPIREPQL